MNLRPQRRKARAVKARYQGACRLCGAPTHARGGKGDTYAYCKKCRPGAIAPRWTQEQVLDAMHTWRARHGRWPSSYDWSSTHARRRGAGALARLQDGDWPAPGTVSDLFGTWARARAAASRGTSPGPLAPTGSRSSRSPARASRQQDRRRPARRAQADGRGRGAIAAHGAGATGRVVWDLDWQRLDRWGGREPPGDQHRDRLDPRGDALLHQLPRSAASTGVPRDPRARTVIDALVREGFERTLVRSRAVSPRRALVG